MFLPSPRPSFNAEDRKDVAKAVAIAALSAVSVKLIEWGWDAIRKKGPREKGPRDEDEDGRGEG